MKSSAKKIELASVDDLFSTEEGRQDAKLEKIQEIPLSEDVYKRQSKACGKDLPYVIDPRRPGDIAECYADPAKARDELGWTAEYGIEEMCASSWKWQSMNPNGYKG